jgi:hypothetical protein
MPSCSSAPRGISPDSREKTFSAQEKCALDIITFMYINKLTRFAELAGSGIAGEFGSITLPHKTCLSGVDIVAKIAY